MLSMLKRASLTAAVVVGGLVSSAFADVRLQGAGATFPNPLYQRWVTEYQKQHPEVKIDYQSIGSGGGIKAITEKTVDFAGSDAPLSKKEAEALGGTGMHIPTTAGAVVLAYNLPGVGELNLSGEVVADIFAGKLTKWNDPKIQALNTGAALPDTVITPAYRTDGSGTTYVFTNYLITQSESFKETVGAGKSVQFPAGQGAKGNEGVTAAVKGTPGAIGYIELNYATANKIPFAAMQNKNGKFIKASLESVSAAGAGASNEMKADKLAVNIWNQPGDNAYPIAAFTYIIVHKDLNNVQDPAKRKALVDFLKWAISDEGGQKFSTELDYAPLADPVQELAAKAIGTLPQ